MFRKEYACVIIFLFIGTSIVSAFNVDFSNTAMPMNRSNTLYVGGSGPGNYTAIQAAINAASDDAPGDLFGCSVSVYGYYALIGAEGDDSYRGSAYVFKRLVINLPPNKPFKPCGKINGKVNITYTYSTSTNDPDGNQIFYWFEWGDGNNSGWIGPFNSGAIGSANHTWTTKGTYQIKVKARDTFGAESDWSDPLSVNIPRSRVIDNPVLRFFENHLLMFRILQLLFKQLQV